VRGAPIVLVDSEEVRAPAVASWLRQLGFDAYVLKDGIRSSLSVPRAPVPSLPVLAPVTAQELASATAEWRVFDLRPSMNFRRSHIPGSRWSTRVRLAADALHQETSIALVAEDVDLARLAAVDLVEAGVKNVKLLEGGLDAWTAAGYATEASPGVPPDAECIDYLFFVHDRHAGNHEAMRQYLDWETGLTAQLDEQDRASFRITAGLSAAPH